MVDRPPPYSHRDTPRPSPLTFDVGAVRFEVNAGPGCGGRSLGRSDQARRRVGVVASSKGERDGLLLERDRELERIGGCLHRAQQGDGGALVVEGPAGIGKTVLLAAGRDTAERDGFRVLRARGAELEREFAFGVVRQLVEPVVAGASVEERAGLLEGPPRVAARLLGLPGLEGGAVATAPLAPDPSFAVLHGLYWLCANLATERPLALVVDDAHWADAASLRFLAFLLPRLEELHAAVLLGARPAEAGASRELLAALTMDPATEVVTVGPLTPRGVATLVAAGLGVEPEPEFAAACWEATGGTPFLVRTLIEALREERIAPVTASAATVHNLATYDLERWVMLRLERLGPDAACLARAVAVLERAELDQAARLAGLELSDAARAADLLVRAGVLEEAPLGFAHPLLRAAVYRDMAVVERADAHARAAMLLSETHAGGARVAEHLLSTAPAGDDWTVEQLRAAAREASARGAPESATAYLRRALSEPPSREVGPGLLLELGTAEFSAGQAGWHDHLEAAVESARDDTTRTAAALWFANALRFHQRLAESVEVCDGVASHLDRRDVDGRLVLEAMAVNCGMIDATTAPQVGDRARALLVLAAERGVPRHVLASAAFVAALANQPAAQVADLARRAIAAGPRPLPEPGDPPWFPSAVIALYWAEHFDEARVLLDAAVIEALAAANGMILPAVLAHRAYLALRRGDLTAAEADVRALRDALGRPPPPLYVPLAMGVLVDVLVERGDLDEAERALERSGADLAGTSVTAITLRHARGRLLFARRRFGEALDDLRAVGEIAIGTGAISPCYLPWRSDAALAALALGEADTARRLSDEEVELARAFGAPRALGVALRAAGLVAGGQRAETLLREAIEVLAGPDTRLEEARALADLGALMRRSNRRVEARQLLRPAINTARHLGAGALAQRAETELRATGARPRRVLLSGLEALTASERRIAELAAEGLTNREIAQTLFVTSRTVEGHLTHVFQKLDVKARTALPAALATPTQAVRA
ncbi:MAG TPA: AAA family ATPase [Acidimicrobiales bacterium]|nr:AAA family ATPase [Acidimicrobiales bacterium]